MYQFFKTAACLTISALVVVGCKSEPTSVAAPAEAPTVIADVQSQQGTQNFAEISGLVEANNRPAALELASTLLADISPSEANILIDTYFDRTSDKKDNKIAIVIAESVAAQDPTNSKAAYLAGLAYWNGITVEKNPARVVGYWDRPSFEGNKAVQSRLAELYGDTTSTIYNAEKAELSRQRAAN